MYIIRYGSQNDKVLFFFFYKKNSNYLVYFQKEN